MTERRLLTRAAVNRRGTVLIAAMVILGCALFIGASLLSVLHSGSAVSAGSRDAAQSRAIARSAVLAIAAELDRQRRDILRGEAPFLEPQYILFEEGSRLGVVRIHPAGLRDELLVSEAGKLDINIIDDPAALEATGLVDATLAAEIIRHRKETLKRPYQSEVELLAVPGMTADMLYGTVERLIARDGEGVEEFESALTGGISPGDGPGLYDVVTVYAVEPALQENGKLRINLNVEWSEELRDRIAQRFGEEIATAVKQIIDQGTMFDSEKRLIEVLRFFQVPPADWFEATDAFTTEPHDYHRGRLDLNRASYESLCALPGVTPEQASQIAGAQESLSYDEQHSIAWPGMLEILAPEQFDALAGRITTRSWTWRVRFEVGMVSADDEGGPIDHSSIYEAVFDLASPEPRIAYLRDVTNLSDVALIASTIDLLLPAEEEADEEAMLDDGDADAEGSDDEQAGGADEETGDLDFGFGDNRRSLDFGGGDHEENEDSNKPEGADGGSRSAGQTSPPPPPRIGRWNAG